MSTFLDQIKSNAVPANVMRTAAKGALPLAPAEMLEVMVYLTHNPVFSQDARMTLASFDQPATMKVVSDPAGPPDVIAYYWMDENRRPALLPALIENPLITETMLIEAAVSESRDVVAALVASRRARKLPDVMAALKENPALSPEEREQLQQAEATPEVEAAATADEAATTQQEQEAAEAAHQAWSQQYVAEIRAAEGKPYVAVGEEQESSKQAEPQPQTEAAVQSDTSVTLAATALAKAKDKVLEQRKMSALQRISKMSVAERVKAAFTGGRDERLILIRDAAKIIQNAVLASPKLTEPEVEGFAAARNVSENVLREISRNRRFMKNYNVGRNLVINPKTPLDVALTLVKNLMIYDLKGLRFNHNVAETIRRVAAEMYRQKSGPAKEAKRKG